MRSAESRDIVDAFEVAVFGDVEELLVQFVVAEALFGCDLEDADSGAGGTGDGGAAMAVGLRESRAPAGGR